MATAADTTALTYAQLKGVWLSASQGTRYHSNAWASLMAAIAEAESSGNPLATNPYDNNGTQTSWGLWQISNGTHEAPAPDWADPDANAKLAIGKLQTQGLGAWGTYQSGAYKAYLSDKTSADLTASYNGPDAVTQAGATAAAEASQACAWGIGGASVQPFFIGPSITLPSICILSKSQLRAMVGATLVWIGGAVMVGGVALLLVQSGAAGRAASLVAFLPGPAGTAAKATETAAQTTVPAQT